MHSEYCRVVFLLFSRVGKKGQKVCCVVWLAVVLVPATDTYSVSERKGLRACTYV